MRRASSPIRIQLERKLNKPIAKGDKLSKRIDDLSRHYAIYLGNDKVAEPVRERGQQIFCVVEEKLLDIQDYDQNNQKEYARFNDNEIVARA